MFENFRVAIGNRRGSEIASRVVIQFKPMHYLVYLHFLEAWGLKLDETAMVKVTVRVREERESPVCKDGRYSVMRKVI